MLTFFAVFAGITYSRTTDSIPVYFAACIDSKTPSFNHLIGFIQGTLLITFSALIGLSAVAYYTIILIIGLIRINHTSLLFLNSV